MAVAGTAPRICDQPVFPCRGLCAAACARHPAALPLGLRPGLLQDGAAVSGRVKVLTIHTTCSGCRETQGETWVGFITHVVTLGWGLWEAQLPASLPSAKAKGVGPGPLGAPSGNAGDTGDGQGSPRCPGLAHRVTPWLGHRASHLPASGLWETGSLGSQPLS